MDAHGIEPVGGLVQDEQLGYPFDVPLGPTVALYLLAASREGTNRWTRRSTAAVVTLLVAHLVATAAGGGTFPAIASLHISLEWAVAWFAGERNRLRREQIEELRRRAVRAEAETERERLLAAAEERARIARDLHDSAGHSISVIALRAGTARMRHDDDPERSRLALEAIEDLARQTVTEIDQMVGRLRDSESSPVGVDAPLGLASLDTLIARHAAAGLDVSVDVAGPVRPLGGPVDQATYRILQEALTNAARHGVGRARIEVGFGATGLDLTVVNPVPAVPAAPVPPSKRGHGLIGMRERAMLLGGTLDAERVERTFCLRARLPYAGQPA